MKEKIQFTIGDLIANLETEPQDNDISFNFCGLNPTGVASFRGSYDQLAISFADEYPEPKVKNVLASLKKAMEFGNTFEGYKGGDYQMEADTLLWVANYGQTNAYTGIYKVKSKSDRTILKTHQFDF